MDIFFPFFFTREYMHSFQLCRWQRLSREQVSTRERTKNDSLITVDVHAKNHFSPGFFPFASLFFLFPSCSSEHRTRKVVRRALHRGGGKTWSRVASIFRLFSLEMRTRMKASENSRVFDSWNEFLIFAIPFPLQRSGNVFRSFKDCAYEEEHRGRVETVPCQHRCRKTSSLPFDSYFEWHPLETLERVTSVTCGGITPAYFSCDYVSCESSKQSACKVSSRTMKSLM